MNKTFEFFPAEYASPTVVELETALDKCLCISPSTTIEDVIEEDGEWES